MIKNVRSPLRSAVSTADTWDLSKLFADDAAWELELKKLERRIAKRRQWQGRLGKTPQLAACLKFSGGSERLAERLGNYAYLRAAEDQANADYQRMLGRIADGHDAVERSDELHPTRAAGDSGRQVETLAARSCPGVVSIEDRTDSAVSPVHAGGRRGAVIGHARGHGRHDQHRLSPIARCRFEVRHSRRRTRAAHRIIARHLHAIIAVPAPRFANERSTSSTTSLRPMGIRWRRSCMARSKRMFITPKCEAIPVAWSRTFQTKSRRRSTTT